MKDLICGSVAQHRLFTREAGVRYHDRTTTRGFHYKCEWLDLFFLWTFFFFFMVFVATSLIREVATMSSSV